MAWRIHDQITRGEIDNRQPGLVEGRLWLAGSDEPIALQLKGNCWSDLAGCLLTFRNPRPDPEGVGASLDPRQEGVVGDMTGSRKVRVPTVDSETLSQLIRDKEEIPTKLGNCIYLEWFSEANGRVVIEAAHYECELSPREWSMDPDQETEQQQENETNLQEFLQNLVNQQSMLDLAEEDDQPLDEFQWEQLLRQSDEITDQYLEALEKFRDEPDCDRLVAEEMGWDWLIEEDDLPIENPLYDFVKDATGEEITDWTDSAGDEEEDDGFDEIDDCHPLAKRARELAVRVYKTADERGLLKDHDTTLLSLFTCTSAAAAKLAGALNALSSDELPDYGFIIATLKRGLTPLHQSIAAGDKLVKEMPEEASWIEPARHELFLIRQETITLMQTFRKKLQG